MRDRIGPGWLLQLSSRLQGRTFGAPGRPARAVLAACARHARGSVERAGVSRQGDERVMGSLAAGGGAAWPASSCAKAHRRGPLPAAPLPRTPPQRTLRRNAPCMTTPCELAGPVVTRQVCRSPDERSQPPGPERRALSGAAPPVSRALPPVASPRRWAQAPTLDTGDLCRPSEPGGEGQARGPARNARGEPLRWIATLGVLTWTRLVELLLRTLRNLFAFHSVEPSGDLYIITRKKITEPKWYCSLPIHLGLTDHQYLAQHKTVQSLVARMYYLVPDLVPGVPLVPPSIERRLEGQVSKLLSIYHYYLFRQAGRRAIVLSR
jgi:hypothetical protein